MKKKLLKFVAWFFAALLLIIVSFYIYFKYLTKYEHVPIKNKISHSADYIDPSKALLNDNFNVCDEDNIYQYYNPERATYSKGKYGIRKHIMSNYKNKNYSDSGYLNFRFVINCKGETGRYVIHENNLNLEPTTFNEDLKNQLFKLTSELKKWNPNFSHQKFRDSYMYISYRIENGKITEILP